MSLATVSKSSRCTSLAHRLVTHGRQQSLHATSPSLSGHSRWSKIKHDKQKKDGQINQQRSQFAQDIVNAVKIFGPDTGANPRLQDVIAKAKRAGFPKPSIEAAIARGQGKSASGTRLETLTVECIVPGNIGVILECVTDNKLRILPPIKTAIKNLGGSASPSTFLFSQRGRITLDKTDLSFGDILEKAIEASAVDVVESAEDENQVIVFTEPAQTRAVTEELSRLLKLPSGTLNSEIVWDANPDTKTGLGDTMAAHELTKFVDTLEAHDVGLQNVYMNATQGAADDDSWMELKSRVSV